jgi:8-oxo-dGTP pyrophosphatase MutT (NUDIX family)
VIVLLLLAAAWPLQHTWPLKGIVVLLVLLLLALWRYMEQRFKATNQAYWSVITLTAKDGKVTLKKAAPADRLTHAGGVVFRMRGGEAQFLLVEATDDPNQWVLPKGHIEERENPRETAVREVHEETGVWASIRADLGSVSYSVHGTVITPQFFLMEAMGRGLRQDRNRKHVWLPLEKAVEQASHPETRKLLQSASVQRELLKSAEQRRARG